MVMVNMTTPVMRLMTMMMRMMTITLMMEIMMVDGVADCEEDAYDG